MNIDCTVFIQEDVVFSHDRIFHLAETPILNKVELYVLNKDEDVLLCRYDVCSHGYKGRDITIPDKIKIGSKVRACYKFEPSTNTFNKKPPLGLRPFVFVAEERQTEILNAINRFVAEDFQIPIDWIIEYNMLQEQKDKFPIKI